MKQLLLYYHTIRYLKLRQIFYQCWYRLKWNYFNFRYSGNIEIKSGVELPWNLPELNKHSNYNGNLSFIFLNREKTFTSEIDWNFMEYGKLWHYHLQYMDYLLDENIPLSDRNQFVIQISERIANGKLKLEPFLVSMRLRNILIFLQKHSIDHPEVNRAIGIQISFLEQNPEYHILANHLLENYITLCFAFVILKDEKKQAMCFKLLLDELHEQILPDGGHYERTPAYHSQILFHLLQLIYLVDLHKLKAIDLNQLVEICEQMLGWLHSFGENDLPLLNDSTKSTTPHVSELLNIARQCKVKPKLITLNQSGYRILKNEKVKLIINCGNITPSYQPGHTHADMLHFVLYFREIPILVDTGVSTYDYNEDRLKERSTRMHNTVSIDNENQSQVWASFRVAKRACIVLIEEAENKITAEVTWHTGLRHRRTFILSDDKLILEDQINQLPDLNGILASNFHFDHLLKDKLQVGKDTLKLSDHNIEIRFVNSQRIIQENYFQAEDFNLQRRSIKISAYFAGSLKTEFSWKT